MQILAIYEPNATLFISDFRRKKNCRGYCAEVYFDYKIKKIKGYISR